MASIPRLAGIAILAGGPVARCALCNIAVGLVDRTPCLVAAGTLQILASFSRIGAMFIQCVAGLVTLCITTAIILTTAGPTPLVIKLVPSILVLVRHTTAIV